MTRHIGCDPCGCLEVPTLDVKTKLATVVLLASLLVSCSSGRSGSSVRDGHSGISEPQAFKLCDEVLQTHGITNAEMLAVIHGNQSSGGVWSVGDTDATVKVLVNRKT